MPTLAVVVAVAVGGALGAVLRLAVTVAGARLVAGGPWAGLPVGTLVVNVAGTLALAALVASGERLPGGPLLRTFLATGVLGALTTFSTFAVDAHGLVLAGEGGRAAAYVGATLLLAGGAVLLGTALGR